MDLVLRKLVTKLRIKMSMLTLAKTVIGGTIAGLTLLALTANSSFADTHNQTASQTIAQTNQAPQQPTEGGCSCCKDMMKNMPGMTGNQSNPSR